MDGRAFLDAATALVAGLTEAHWRTAAGRAYYALFHEGRAALQRWGFAPQPRENLHSFVRLRFNFPANADLKRIGKSLEDLGRLRNQADYHLALLPSFTSSKRAQKSIRFIVHLAFHCEPC